MDKEQILALAKKADETATQYLQCAGEYHPDYHSVRDEHFYHAAIAKATKPLEDQLTARVRELEEENARLRLKTINLKTQIEDDDKSAIATIDDLKGQLAASQLHAEQLRMALESCYEKMKQMCLNGEWYAPDKAIDLAYTALALPHDTSKESEEN